MKKLPIKYDFSPNSLFRNGPDTSLNACVGENGGPYDLFDYGMGFFEGGRLIIAGAKDGLSPVDIAVYPAAFAFRHGIELYLKHLLDRLSVFNQMNPTYGKNHGIREYYDLVAEQLEIASSVAENPIDIQIARDIIEDFNQIDPTGQVFRYPEDLKGNKHLTGLKLINVEVLDDGMRIFREIVEGWISRLERLQEAKRSSR